MAQFSALGTDFIIAISEGAEEIMGSMDFLSKLGFSFMVTPVVAESLHWVGLNEVDPIVREAAAKAYGRLSTFGILTPDLTGVDRDFTRMTADKWHKEKLYPEADMNDYLAITEASRLEAQNLIIDRPIAKIDPGLLNKRLLEAQLNPLRLIELSELIS